MRRSFFGEDNILEGGEISRVKEMIDQVSRRLKSDAVNLSNLKELVGGAHATFISRQRHQGARAEVIPPRQLLRIGGGPGKQPGAAVLQELLKRRARFENRAYKTLDRVR